MSQIWEYIKIALMNIKSNKGRSVLTMLGIIIGISSVIMIISIGNGIKGQVNSELDAMAGGQIYLYLDNKENTEGIEMTNEDFEVIAEEVDNVKGVTPDYAFGGATAKGRKGNVDAMVEGGNEYLQYIYKNPIIKGRYFTAADNASANKVCVITENSAKMLFGTTDVVGLTIEVTAYNLTHEFQIIGIRQDDQSALLSMMNGSSRAQIEIPINTMGVCFYFYVEGFDGVYIIGESSVDSTQIAKEAMRIIETRHNIRGEGIVKVESFSDYLTNINSVLGYITIFVVFVAAISLLVGGIGVMNIMLVSVTERTREIGIRKALGAKTGSIMLQFLSESAIITLIGGIIGITIGVSGAMLVCSLIGFTAKVEAVTVIGASVFSSGVGIFFGIYPAKKAAKLSPIEALRHE